MTLAVIVATLGLAWSAVGEQTPSERMEMGIGGGGPLVSLIFLDLASLNGVLEANDYAPLSEEMRFFGGGGGGGLVQGFRFGGFGGNGEVVSVNTENGKRAALSLGFGGFLLSYGLASLGPADLTLGSLIGGGGATLTLTAHRPERFEDAVARATNTVLTRGFFAVQPQTSLGVPVLSWLSLRISAGYLLTVGSDWELDGIELPGPPEHFHAWSVSVMVEFGGRGDGEQEEE